MGTLNRGELRAEVNANLGNRTDSTPANITTRVNRLLDLAQTQIAREYDWKELQEFDQAIITPTGTKTVDKYYNYSISNLREFHALIRKATASEESHKLTQVPQRQWDRLVARTDLLSTGEDAYFYCLWKSRIEWFPVPTRQFTLDRRYTIWPAAFADDNETSDLDNKDDIIITCATHLAFQSLGMRDDAASFFGQYQNLIQRARVQDQKQPDLDQIPRGTTAGEVQNPLPWGDPFVKRW